MRLEVEPQAELHAAVGRERRVVSAEVGACGCLVQSIGTGVKADCVGDVVDFGGELEFHLVRGRLAPVVRVRQAPGLGDRGVDVKLAISAEVIALARFSRIGQPNGCAGVNAIADGGGGGGVEDVENAVFEVSVGLNATDVKAHGGVVVVGGKRGGFDGKGQSAGPAC